MFCASAVALRRRTAWRALLHPLPMNERRRQLLRRDVCERNEEILRRPYYTLRPIDPTVAARRETLQFPAVIGPQAAENQLPADVAQLRPHYTESWETVPVHQPSSYQ
jgi:hypothetical protein